MDIYRQRLHKCIAEDQEVFYEPSRRTGMKLLLPGTLVQ